MLKLKVISLIILVSFVFSCNTDQNNSKAGENNKIKHNRVWRKIKENGKLVAVTQYTSTDYFIYKGQPMGFQYELIKRFSESLDLDLEVVLSNNLEESFILLQDGEYDLMAINLTVTKDRSKMIDFSHPIGQTRQILVQRKPENWKTMRFKEYDSHMIRSRLDLAKKKVYVKNNTSFVDRLKALSDEIGDTIYIQEMENYSVEEIIAMVASGDIDYTVCDENVAKVNATYYENIDIKTNISFSQNLSWAVQKGEDSLMFYLNAFIDKEMKHKWYSNLYNKYYRNIKSVHYFRSEYLSLNSNKISPYDEIIKNQTQILGWDWRLLASLIYQESRFNPNVESWAGAYGLMQMMPSTAERFGLSKKSSVDENIRGGTEFLSWLNKQFEFSVPDSIERVKFILASYNTGYGHVQDAMRLASKNGKDSSIWEDHVEYYLLHKSNPKYFLDPVVKFGYCRGSEPVKYVSNILQRFEEYKKVIHE